MHVSPLLSKHLVAKVTTLIKQGNKKEKIMEVFQPLPLEEKIHILRFIYKDLPMENLFSLYEVWRSYISYDHALNTKKHRRAIHEIGKWWDTYSRAEDLTIQQYDELETLLDSLGTTPEGIEYFKWIALYPVGVYVNGPEQVLIWDEHRRGAVICLARYAYSKEMELFLARHLDDWNTIQMEVMEILAALKSRLLPKLASWYMKNNSLLKPHFEEYGFEEIME